MLRILILMLLSFNAVGDEWRIDDTRRETVYQMLHIIDWAQTRSIARDPARWHENNTIIGRHPTVGRVDGYMALSGLLHVGISRALPHEYRAAWQCVTIGVVAGTVWHNFSVGIDTKF